jgi:hypothetical protein
VGIGDSVGATSAAVGSVQEADDAGADEPAAADHGDGGAVVEIGL